MKAKREKQFANMKKKKEAEKEAKVTLKNRLMALDAKAINAATKVVYNNSKNSFFIKTKKIIGHTEINLMLHYFLIKRHNQRVHFTISRPKQKRTFLQNKNKKKI